MVAILSENRYPAGMCDCAQQLAQLVVLWNKINCQINFITKLFHFIPCSYNPFFVLQVAATVPSQVASSTIDKTIRLNNCYCISQFL
jgi:hypothetical protein